MSDQDKDSRASAGNGRAPEKGPGEPYVVYASYSVYIESADSEDDAKEQADTILQAWLMSQGNDGGVFMIGYDGYPEDEN